MSDSLRRTGGGRGWRLLARTLVVAGATAAGTSVGWLAHAAEPVLPEITVPGPAEQVAAAAVGHADGAAAQQGRAMIDDGAQAADSRHPDSRPAADDSAPSLLSLATDTARGLVPAPQPEPDSAEAGEFALHDLDPQRLVGTAESAADLVPGAHSLLDPLSDGHSGDPAPTEPAPPAAEPEPPAWTPEAPPAPLAARPPPSAVAPLPHHLDQPRTAPEPAADGGAVITSESPDSPAPPLPWPPRHPGLLPAPPAAGCGCPADGLGHGGGLGITGQPPSSTPLPTAAQRVEHPAARALLGAEGSAPGTTPD